MRAALARPSAPISILDAMDDPALFAAHFQPPATCALRRALLRG